MRLLAATLFLVATMENRAVASVVLNGGPVQMRNEAVIAPLPVYPAKARASGRQGLVVVRIEVRADGAVTGVVALESFDRDAGQSVTETVKRWRFQPLKKDPAIGGATRIGKLLFRFVIERGVPKVLDLPAAVLEFTPSRRRPTLERLKDSLC